MHLIDVRNVNDALAVGYDYLIRHGERMDSRNGEVLVSPVPVITRYRQPAERVLFDPIRNANPFFHLAEAFWMLLGRDDLKPLTRYVKNMANYSDDGKTLAGAYGYRWRHHFGYDQIEATVNALRRDPLNRRVVISMFDPIADAKAIAVNGKDIPCNLLILPRIHEGKLDITVCNRSNDMVWGAYGANAVHFSVLQEYLAYRLHLGVGNYWQVSNNFHMYLETSWKQARASAQAHETVAVENPYEIGAVEVMPMFHEYDSADLQKCLDPNRLNDHSYRMPFVKQVAIPMFRAHAAFKTLGGTDGLKRAIEILNDDGKERNDWVQAGLEWFIRRLAKLERQKDDGISYE